MKYLSETICNFRNSLRQSEYRLLLVISLTGLFIRVLFYLYFTQAGGTDFFEYGEITKNLISGNGYSLFWFSETDLEYKSTTGISPFPSAYMAPGFTFIILPLFLTKNALITHIGYILFQSLLYFLILFLIIRLALSFSSISAIIAFIIFAFNPEFIAAFKSPTPVLLYHLLILIIIFMAANGSDSPGRIILLGIVTGAGLLIRFEFILTAILIPVTLAVRQKRRSYIIAVLIAMAMLSPWILRNYAVFGEPLLSTSTGLNLYRGNNPYGMGTWADEKIDAKIKSLPRNSQFELHFNKMYTDEAVNFIRNDISGFFLRIPEKVSGLFFVSTGSIVVDAVQNFMSVILLISFLLYLFGSPGGNETKAVLLVILLSAIVVTAVFFSIPRYGTMLRIIFVPFVYEGMRVLVSAVSAKKQQG